jgi:hypothetical protein
MFGEIDSAEQESVEKSPKKRKHKIAGKGGKKKAKKHSKKKHHGKKKAATK